jgi:RNA polymerase primary sigma factor
MHRSNMDGWRMRWARVEDDGQSSEADLTFRGSTVDYSGAVRTGKHDADIAYIQALRRIPRLEATEEACLAATQAGGVEAAKHLEHLHGTIPSDIRARTGCIACLTAAKAFHTGDTSRRIEHLRNALPTNEITKVACDASCPAAFDAVRAGADARLRLIESGLRYVIPAAQAYAGRGMPLVDLIHEGAVGLTRAVDRFDARAGLRLQAYAYWWIRQSIRRALANYIHIVRLPLIVIERLDAIARASVTLAQDLGRPPTPNEIAAHIGIPLDQLQEMEDIGTPVLSLNYPTPGGDAWNARGYPLSASRAQVPWDDDGVHPDDAIDPTIGDVLRNDLPPPDARLIASLMAREVAELLRILTPRQATVVCLRQGFNTPSGEPATLDEVGERISLTRERVRQIEAEAMARLRRTPAGDALHAYLEDG